MWRTLFRAPAEASEPGSTPRQLASAVVFRIAGTGSMLLFPAFVDDLQGNVVEVINPFSRIVWLGITAVVLAWLGLTPSRGRRAGPDQPRRTGAENLFRLLRLVPEFAVTLAAFLTLLVLSGRRGEGVVFLVLCGLGLWGCLLNAALFVVRATVVNALLSISDTAFLFAATAALLARAGFTHQLGFYLSGLSGRSLPALIALLSASTAVMIAAAALAASLSRPAPRSSPQAAR